MRLKNLDLFLVVLIVALNVGWTQVPTRPLIVSVVVALPLVLFLPGYTLTQLLFRRKVPANKQAGELSSTIEATEQEKPSAHTLRLGHPIGKADQLILSFGLSMAIDILVGFTLNLLPIGLQALSWVFSLGLLTVLFALMALLLRRKRVVSTKESLPLRVTLLDGLFFVIALFIVLNAAWLAIIRPPQPQPSFTQFWILPANAADKSCAVSIGIQSFEVTSLQYNVTMLVNNQTANNWTAISLTPQQKWSIAAPVALEAQNDLRVEARLYRVDQPKVIYRDVYLTFHVSTQLVNGKVQQQCALGT